MKVAALQMTRFLQRLNEQISRLVLCALVSSMLVPSGLAAATPDPSVADTPSMAASPEIGLEATGFTAPSIEDAPATPLRLAQFAAPPRYGFSSVASLAARSRPEPSGDLRPLSARPEKLGMSDGEILVWSTGIGATVGLAAGLINGEDEVKSTLKGAGIGFIAPIIVAAMGVATFPHVAPARPARPLGLSGDGGSTSQLRSPATPLLSFPISDLSARGDADRYVAIGVGRGFHLSYVIGW